jgi:hypothetical protein
MLMYKHTHSREREREFGWMVLGVFVYKLLKVPE